MTKKKKKTTHIHFWILYLIVEIEKKRDEKWKRNDNTDTLLNPVFHIWNWKKKDERWCGPVWIAIFCQKIVSFFVITFSYYLFSSHTSNRYSNFSWKITKNAIQTETSVLVMHFCIEMRAFVLKSKGFYDQYKSVIVFDKKKKKKKKMGGK